MGLYYEQAKRNGEEHYTRGETAERRFSMTCRNLGLHYKVHDESTVQERNKHFDFYVWRNGEKLRVEVKAPKKLARSCQDVQYDWQVIEFLGDSGKQGWIHGKADFLAFEMERDFIIVSRKKLKRLAFDLCDGKEIVKRADESYYKLYSRNGLSLTTMISIEDILSLDHERWSKPDEAIDEEFK